MKKFGTALLTIFPCLVLTLAVGYALAKPSQNGTEKAQTEVLESEYDMSHMEELLTQISAKQAQDKDTAEKTQAKASEYTDGTYYGTGTGFRGSIKVCVVVTEKKIRSIEVVEVEADDAAYVERAKGVIDEVIRSQSTEVDAVSGASYSSRGILEAIKNALTGEASTSTAAAAASTQTAAPSAVSEYTAPKNGYQDGTYTGSGTGFGGTIKVSVKIKKGKIKKIEVLSAPGEGADYLAAAKGVIPKMIAAQSPKVDAVSGATYSSNGIMNAVKDALRKAKKSGSSETEKETRETETESQTQAQTETETVVFEKPAAYKDGTYTASAKGFKGNMTVTVTISGGKITDIQIESKDTEEYLNKAKQLITQIISAQDVSGIDVITGATFSSNGILNGVKLALQQAAVNPETEKQTETQTAKETETAAETESETQPASGQYVDGTYSGTALGFAHDITAVVTVNNGFISSITATADDAYETDEEDKEWLPDCRDAIVSSVLKKQQTAGIDTVSGATFSSQGLISAIEQALAQAGKTGE